MSKLTLEIIIDINWRKLERIKIDVILIGSAKWFLNYPEEIVIYFLYFRKGINLQ